MHHEKSVKLTECLCVEAEEQLSAEEAPAPVKMRSLTLLNKALALPLPSQTSIRSGALETRFSGWKSWHALDKSPASSYR
ncbi:hypothetical protein DNTS_018084 [Danionella cerebrum]|uniref:Uncharacterized protein n=1 Tax=Danionella cerebrum TaxID=2873325 RepID=A0A553QGW4_9TELE|nr:hypothetical protein DNTS_018084 [Danionella translucida]